MDLWLLSVIWASLSVFISLSLFVLWGSVEGCVDEGEKEDVLEVMTAHDDTADGMTIACAARHQYNP